LKSLENFQNILTDYLTAVSPKEGPGVSVVGNTYRIIIGSEQTNEAYTLIDMLIPPKGGPVPHSHATFQEAFYIIDGEIKVITLAIKGSYVSLNSLERKNEVSIIVGPLTGQSDWSLRVLQ
jgi:hypothetical protein